MAVPEKYLPTCCYPGDARSSNQSQADCTPFQQIQQTLTATTITGECVERVVLCVPSRQNLIRGCLAQAGEETLVGGREDSRAVHENALKLTGWLQASGYTDSRVLDAENEGTI